jgi:predicted metal-dependent enzyme (double-stranded beta helix superfamily)
MSTDFARALGDVMGDGEFARAMERFARSFADYRERLPLIPHAYSRTRLAIAPEYEIVAMNWAPESISPVHDHGASRCWVLMLDGALDVQNFACDPVAAASPATIRETERLELRPGDIDHRLGPNELHRVRNPSRLQSAFSLQLYARPLSTYSVFDVHSGQRRIATATCELDLTLRSPA